MDAIQRSLASVRRHVGLGLTYQRRSTQSRVKMSRSARTGAGAPDWTPPGWNPDATIDACNGDRSDCWNKRAQVGGRSRVIHAFLVGC
jgi:hypothetical protein